MMNAVDKFKITIRRKGTHGAYPHQGIDPINIGVHIHLALQKLIAREANPVHLYTYNGENLMRGVQRISYLKVLFYKEHLVQIMFQQEKMY